MKRIAVLFINASLCAYLVVGGISPVQASQAVSQSRQADPAVFKIYLPLALNGSPLPPIIPDTTRVLGDAVSHQLASISADGTIYTFTGDATELQNLEVGDILIGEASPVAPAGFLRKVSAINTGAAKAKTSGEVQVTTTEATQEEAIQQISLQIDHILTPAEIQNASTLNALHLNAIPSAQGLTFEVPLEKVVLYDADGNPESTNDQVVADGSISLAPSIHLNLVILDHRIQSLTFSVTGQEQVSLTISSEAELPAKREYVFPTIIMGAIPTPIGPVVPQLTFKVGVDGNLHMGVSSGISDTSVWTAGVRFNQNQWENVAGFTNQFSYDPPTLTSGMDAKAYIAAEFSLMVDGIAGPYAKTQAYLKLEADPAAHPWWTLYAGLSAKAGVEIKIFSFLLANYEAELFKYEKALAPMPTVDVQVNDSDGPLNLNSQASYTVTWSSANASSCAGSNAMDGWSGFTGSRTIDPGADGSYTYTMTCSNATGNATDSVVVNIAIPSSYQATSVTTGWDHTCALTQTGGVKCWGGSSWGQLGNWDNYAWSSSTPVDVNNLASGVSSIAAGTEFNCAISNEGGVKCWGRNYEGQLGNGTTTSHITYDPTQVSGLTSNMAALAAGEYHACALTTGGGVKCWGNYNFDAWGQLGNGVDNGSTTPVDASDLTSGVVAIAAGWEHTCALTSAGAVLCWGYNNYGQLGDGTRLNRNVPVQVSGLESGVSAISAGGYHTCALQTDGLVCWGSNTSGELGDAKAEPWSSVPVAVNGLASGVTNVYAGDYDTCALVSGFAKCWGLNDYGQLGDGTNTNQSTPVEIAALGSEVQALSLGWHHTCARLTGGALVCLGRNNYGELGNGTTIPSLIPVNVVGFP